MTPRCRKLLLAIHIAFSVGWMGAVLAYLALVVAAMSADGEQRLRAIWISLDVIGWSALVPLAIGALLTGVAIALGTPWGLFRHYWVLTSLLLTAVATGVLLGHMPTVSALADLAARSPTPAAAGILTPALRGELLHAGGGLVVLLAIAFLNVFKPRGMTAYGRRHVPAVAASVSPDVRRAAHAASGRWPPWVHAVWIHAAVLILLLAMMHVTGETLRLH